MGTITLKNLRTTADVTMNTTLKDGGVFIDWASLSDIKAWLWSDKQGALAGRCNVKVDDNDSTKLICEYASTKPQYPGVNRLIVQASYMGATKTYDKPAFNFVRWTGDQSGQQVTIDDPEVDVEIMVEDVSSSILDKILAACLKATEEAREVVDTHRGPRGFSAYELAVQDGFDGTEEEWLASLIGPAGESAYQLAVDQGYEGTLADWLASLKGPAGDSAYQVAVEEGFVGTKAQWLASLVGPQGLSAYQVAVVEGFEGSVSEWLASLVGPVGPTPNFSIGTVQTGAAGTQAAASITGTAEAPVLNLTIPRGDTGVAPEDLQEAVDNYLEDHPTVSGTFLNNAKHKLIQLLQKVAYVDGNGQSYLEELTALLFLAPIDHIDADYTQGDKVIYDIYSLDKLKDDLVVTIYYSDGSHAVTTDYVLSGSLVGGTSTINVSVVDNVTGDTVIDTFNVSVTGTLKLYIDGDECSAVTGGWQTTGCNITSRGNPTVSKESSYLLIKFNSAPSSGTTTVCRCWSTSNPVNISAYTKVIVEWEGYNTGGGGNFWCYFAESLADSESFDGAYGADSSNNRVLIGDSPYRATAGVVKLSIKDKTTSYNNAYLSLPLNLWKSGDTMSVGAYVKIKKVALATE